MPIAKKKKTGVAGIKKKRPRVAAIKINGKKPVQIGRLAAGNKIIGQIEFLEKQRKKEVLKLKRDLLQLEINSLHDKLDKIYKAYKSLK